MNAPNVDVARFCAIFLPPADLIVSSDPTRNYLNKPNREAAALVNALAAKVAEPIERAQQAFQKKSEEIHLASQPAADKWIENAFSAIATRLAGIPIVTNQYANDILYMVTSPEFGLNGWKDSPGPDGVAKWDATGAFPQSLEGYIRGKVRDKLATAPFNHFHILFIFSCFTHSTTTMVPEVELGKGGSPKIVANNRLSIVCLENPAPDHLGHVFYTVTKFAWNPVDVVHKSVFTPEMGWDSATQKNLFGMKNRPRDVETQITLPWKSVDDTPIVLGLGTCQDVLVDRHPTERLVIFCGSGTPFMRVSEVPDLPMTYPFLLNDRQSWSVAKAKQIRDPTTHKMLPGRLRLDELQSAGYYQFLKAAPVDTPSVAQNHADLYNADGTPHLSQDRPNMAQCYLHPKPVESDPPGFVSALAHETPILVSTTGPAAVPLFKYTNVLDLPPVRKG